MPPLDPDQQDRWHPWQPDGWGWRGRLGLLLPHADTEPDTEFAVLAPEGVSTHAMRVPWPRVAGQDALTRARAFAEPPGLDDAAETLAAVRPQAIALCFTSSSYVLGPDGDVALKARLEVRTQGIPVAITCVAAVSALRTVGARRVALIHPPWFTDDMDQRGVAYFQHQGFDVVSHARAPLRPDRGQIHPGPLYEWARGQVPREADAVFVGGNGMRTIGAIQALEGALGIPVLTSNQVVFWQALHLAHITARVERYGQLFDYTRPGPQP
jgi:maleate isomerase